jgi:hypothetical protein
MIEYFFVLLVIGAVGYCAYWFGHIIGYQKCQDVYEKYLDKRFKTMYNSSNDNNTK